MTSALFSLGSCEDTNELGIDLPGTTDISTDYEDFPAAAIQASTVLQDSLFTTQKDHYIVGRLQDGGTGALLEARSFLEVAASFADTLPSQFTAQTPMLDSVVMYAGFDRVYGSATAPFRLSVYDLQAPLDDFTPYNSKSSIPLAQPIVLDEPVSLNRTIRNKANTLDSLTGLPIRIPLSKAVAPTAFANQLFTKLRTTSTVFLTDQDLRTVWKGIGLVTTSTGTAVAFNRSAQSLIYVYYHLTIDGSVTPPVRKNKVFRLIFNDPNQVPAAPRYFTNISYNLAGAGSPFGVLQGNGLAQVPSASSGGTVYAQNGTGLVTKLVIPGLDILRARQAHNNLIINRAELIIPLRPYSTAQFTAPSVLYLYEANNDNNRPLIYTTGFVQLPRVLQAAGNVIPVAPSVQNPRPELEFTLTEASATNKYYTGLVTDYVQAYTRNQLAGTTPTAFLLSPTLRRTSAPFNLDRAAIDAQNIKLRVYYSKATAR